LSQKQNLSGKYSLLPDEHLRGGLGESSSIDSALLIHSRPSPKYAEMFWKRIPRK
jgi:hypothetical protein